MITQELLDYIQGRLDAGESREAISASLASTGWQADAIAEAWQKLDTPVQSPAMALEVETSPATSTPVQMTAAETVDKNLHVKVILLLVALALILAGGAYFYWNSLQSPAEESPVETTTGTDSELPEGIEAINPMEDADVLEELPELENLMQEEPLPLEEEIEVAPEEEAPVKVPAPKVKVKPADNENSAL